MSTAHAKQIFYGKLEATEDVIRVIRDYGIDAVDLRFADIYGHWRSFAVSTSALDLKSFERCGEFPGQPVSGISRSRCGGDPRSQIRLP